MVSERAVLPHRNLHHVGNKVRSDVEEETLLLMKALGRVKSFCLGSRLGVHVVLTLGVPPLVERYHLFS